MSDPNMNDFISQSTPRQDSFLSAERDIGELVLKASEEVWKKIKKVLNVQTREQAATMVQADPKAKQLLMSVFEKNAATPKQPVKPLAEQMYGSKPAKVEF